MTDIQPDPNVPNLVPARMVNEFSYCQRLFFLEWVNAQFADNTDTVEGRWAHRAVDAPSGRVPLPDEGAVRVARSVQLSSAELGLVAKVDLLEGAPDGTVVPIETKRGSPPGAVVGAGAGAGVRSGVVAPCTRLRGRPWGPLLRRDP